MDPLHWLKSLRGSEPVTAADFRRQLAALRRQQTETVEQRDALALDAVRDDTAAERWATLDAKVHNLTRRIDVLTAALPQAEAKEAEAARLANAEARAQHMQNYQRQTAEAKQWADAVIARLTTGEELTEARTLRDALRDEARALSRWSHDVSVRRPFDPLEAIHGALTMRIQRIERARWLRSDRPITLRDERAAS